jgi:hypothetical protein
MAKAAQGRGFWLRSGGFVANMCSMGNAGSAGGRFQRALQRGSLPMALAEAHALPRIPLEHAFVLCLLLRGDRRYPRAAARWQARIVLERNLTLGEAQLVAGLLAELERDPQTVAPTLSEILRRHKLRFAADRLDELAAGVWPHGAHRDAA